MPPEAANCNPRRPVVTVLSGRMKAPPEGAGHTDRGLTHSLDLGKEGLPMNGTRTCSVDGCGRPVNARGWCSTHWWRWKKHGDVMADVPVRARDRGKVAPSPDEECSVEDCKKPIYRKGRRLCSAHHVRLVRYGSPTFKPPLAKSITYRGAHKRVTRARGPASAHECVDCGGTAHHWSYDHTDPNELVEVKYTNGVRCEAPYSLDVGRYDARCRSCHGKLDFSLSPERPRHHGAFAPQESPECADPTPAHPPLPRDPEETR